MIHVVTKLLVPVLMLAALPVSAEPLENDIDIVMARVVTQYDGPLDCLAPVAINRIDNELRALPAQGFLIEPGTHAINGLATLDITKCRPISANQYIGSTPDLEVNFEAGKTYYIAYDRGSLNIHEWKLVVWKVEPDKLSKLLP